ncbi:MAG: tRNA lysidine(34) synthetase TilS, partial [Flavisolibacter sp.]|nr:tRNA lysidine(34) synthetase TilS [Flavisolibacter sp.]
MLPERFTGFFNYHKVPRNSRFLVAVSGGVDSVVLAKLCKISAFDFSIVHCNFNLRGDESSRDAAFVEQLAATYQVPYFSESFDTSGYVAEHKLSLQEAARNLRYQFFKETAVAQNFHYTLLAHHAGDNAETLMMHFFRGTGLKGLTGIPEIVKTEQQLLRPMLQFRKEAIVSYAQEQQLEWVEDQSNASTKYTRNFFRHEVLPLVKKVYPQADENLQNNINRFKGIYSIYQSAIEAIKKDLVEKYFDEVRIPVK